MSWTKRSNIPSSTALTLYAQRMAAREWEIRRPARKINVISNEEWAKMMKKKADEERQEEELQTLWQTKHLEAIRQRNNMIRYKLFLLFKENFNINTSNAEVVSKQPLARAIAAVCNSITKDAVLYTQMGSFPELKENKFPWYEGMLSQFASETLGTRVDSNDIWCIMSAIKEEKTLLELISSQLKRDLKEVTAIMELHKKLSSIPGYSDPKFAEMVKSVVFRQIQKVDESRTQFNGAPKTDAFTDEQYVAAVYENLDEAARDRGLNQSTATASRLRVNPEQLKALKSMLNTKVNIRAFYDFCTDKEWSKSVEGLLEEKQVLESLLGSNSDVILRTINETIAETYLAHNRLVEESAKVRNEVLGSREVRFGMLGRMSSVNTHAITQPFEQACKEESVKFKDMENDTAYRELFSIKSTSGQHLTREVSMFTMSGLM